MTKEVSEMIFELMRLVEKEIGTKLDHDAAYRIEEAICRQYGGERVYVQKLPKLVAQVRIAALGTGVATTAMAQATGLSPRRIRQIVRGK